MVVVLLQTTTLDLYNNINDNNKSIHVYNIALYDNLFGTVLN